MVEKEMAMYDDSLTELQNLLKEVKSYDECSDSAFLKNMLLYSQSVLNRWNALKALILKQKLSFQNLTCKWGEFFKDLENLENWLKSKEDAVSEVDYCALGFSRKDYLEGLGKFEKLNHGFQDDIHLLHSVNSSFHDISKADITVDGTIKERVLTANDHWHKLYNRVSEIFGALKNILQTWDDFDHLKEHLLLFLTETDVKLTEMETTTSFQESSFKSIEEDFNFHEDEKERYLATAKHLMKLSDSSSSIIQASIDEVLSYWEELYKRLCSLHKADVHALQKTEISHEYSENVQMKAVVSKEESRKTLKKGTADSDEIEASQFEPKQMYGKSTCLSEESKLETGSKTYSEVVALGSKKLDETISQTGSSTCSAWETVTDKKVEKECRVPFEKQTVLHSAPKKQKSFDDECIKDLLAALKEAEERMDSLEKVLSELTPTGIDEQGPNYSRLLAACRSSVDVIQHLSQFLFDDIPHEKGKPKKTEIKQQSEDLLHRWQRIELLALNKESRAIENRKNWENFSKELKNFETWLKKAFDDCSSESCSDSDVEKLLVLLQRHKELISQIRAQKKNILTLNLTSQKFLSKSSDSSKATSLKERIKNINDHWDSLCAVAVQWQNKLQAEFLHNSEFKSTLDEMKLWLKESEKKIDEMCKVKQRNDAVLHEQHTELYALKQQLQICCNRLETLLEITSHLFLMECDTTIDPNMRELQLDLNSNLKVSRSLLIKCTEMLKGISSLLGFSKFQEHLSESQNGAASASGTDGDLTDRSQCCSFFMRVARASFPIQAILLLLLGAAILLPMEEEEELSCRLSNNFAASLNPMLRYPDGPPPV